MGLLAAGFERHPAVARAVSYLVAMQNDDGTWDEPEFTGTGFPRVFYLRYDYYRIYFPLLALSTWAVKVKPEEKRSAISQWPVVSWSVASGQQSDFDDS